MTSPLVPNSKREALRKDLQTWIVGQTITFAATVTERFEDSCDQSNQPVYASRARPSGYLCCAISRPARLSGRPERQSAHAQRRLDRDRSDRGLPVVTPLPDGISVSRSQCYSDWTPDLWVIG